MPHKPQRPFVPHRTPAAQARSVVPQSFRLPRPFVPPGVSVTPDNESKTAKPATTIARDEPSRAVIPVTVPTLPGIEEFFDELNYQDEADQLPPIEHFVDPLPDVGGFAPEYGLEAEPGESLPGPELPADEAGRSGWVAAGWQEYNWGAAAELGEGGGSASPGGKPARNAGAVHSRCARSARAPDQGRGDCGSTARSGTRSGDDRGDPRGAGGGASLGKNGEHSPGDQWASAGSRVPVVRSRAGSRAAPVGVGKKSTRRGRRGGSIG